MLRLRRVLGNQGTTLFELMTVVTIVGLSTGVAVSRINAGTRSIDSTSQELVANLRVCRMQAIASGYHCRVNIDSTGTYEVERMLPPATPGGSWTADPSQTRAITLPSAVRFGASGTYEFDTRGAVVGRSSVATISLTDGGQGRTASVAVWPSGQIA